ncbi:MAG: rhodanese-like domain-containing protein [Candidatus Latescibacterota bacterium]
MKAKTLFLIAILLILTGSAFAYTDISADGVKAKMDAHEDILLLDVREPGEYDPGHIPGAVNYPYSSGVLQARFGDLPTDKPIIVICQSGARSAAASAFLVGKGFGQILNMPGGMNGWTYETITTEEEQTPVQGGSWASIKGLFR